MTRDLAGPSATMRNESPVTSHPSRRGSRVAAALALLLALRAGGAAAADFVFAVFGDTPYNADEESRFIAIIAELNREPLAFVVHVGDFKAAITPCSDELFLQRREWFELIRHPLVYVPGDNEWTDCRRAFGRGRDPLERMQKLRELFAEGNSSLGQSKIALARQSQIAPGHNYPEHARWERDGVLFLTLNAPGPDNNSRTMPDEFSRRSAAIRDWLEQGFRQARSRALKAVVVIMHANPWYEPGKPRRGFNGLIARLAAETRNFRGEVLLVHGDTHHYQVDRPPLDAANGAAPANFTRVEVFGSPFANWVRIRVSEEDGRVQFDVTPGS
ncbi:MAG TPA: hypothetical protein VKF40_02090 [Burkholderiales bacterium]|nr:hypothetical protein [Burkholderiales bacterium]